MVGAAHWGLAGSAGAVGDGGKLSVMTTNLLPPPCISADQLSHALTDKGYSVLDAPTFAALAGTTLAALHALQSSGARPDDTLPVVAAGIGAVSELTASIRARQPFAADVLERAAAARTALDGLRERAEAPDG